MSATIIQPLTPLGVPVDSPQPHPSGWRGNPWARLGVFLAVVVALGLVAVGVTFLVDPTGPQSGPGEPTLAIGLIVAFLCAHLVVAWRVEGRRPVELLATRAGGLVGGVVLGTAVVMVCVGLVAAFGGLAFDGWREGASINWPRELLMTGAFAAVVEEVLLRGVALRLVEQSWGTRLGLVVSAVLFGLPHVFTSNAPVVRAATAAFLAGALFGAIYVLTRSLWWVMGIHAAWNTVASLGFSIPVSGNVNEGLVVTHPAGPDLLSGGAHGIESSLVSIAVLAVLAAVAWWYAARRGLMVPRRVFVEARQHPHQT